MFHEYPYSLYFSDIDRMCGLCHKAGYKLDVHGNNLRLVDGRGNVVSDVVISYADHAMYDVDERPIRSYVLSASTGATTLILQHGDGTVTSLELPYARSAKEDTLGKDLTSYAYTIGVSNNDLLITRGDGTSYTVTVPFATAAAETVTGVDLTTLAATLAVDGDNLVLRDTEDRELSRITVPYATRATGDGDGDEITSTYGSILSTGTTTVKLIAKEGELLSEITVPFATMAATDTAGHAFLTTYAKGLVVDGDGKRIGTESQDGTRTSTITVPFATESTDATNAIERVQVIGDNIVFTTYGGQSFSILPSKAVKAERDDLNNVIKNTYFASAQNDPLTGSISFYDATGTLLATLTPTVTGATYDSEGNKISDYVKSVAADAQSDYVLVTHGDGTVDSVLINYAQRAWKDSLGQVIQNYYVSWLTCEEDVEDGHYKIYMWNGDQPRAEIGRFEVTAYSAQTDINGKDLTTYVASVEVLNNKITVVDGAGNTMDEITGEVDLSNLSATFAGDAIALAAKTVKTVNLVGTLPSCTYDSTTQTLTFDPGTLMSYADTVVADQQTITPTGTVTITGGTVPVDFDD